MADQPYKKSTSYLSGSQQGLQSVFSKLKELSALSEKILPLIDLSLTPYCQLANRIGNRIVIMTANGSIATELRLKIPELLKKMHLEPSLRSIHEISIKVSPPMAKPAGDRRRQSKKPMQPLSPESAQIMRDIAETIEDEKLRKVMERIAEHTSKDD